MHAIRKKLKRLFLRLIAAKGDAWQVAGGVSVGLFWGLSPLWGLQTIMALVSATALNVSRIPAAIFVHISNPFTVMILYPLTWKLGDLVLAPFVGPGAPLQLHHPLSLGSIANLAGGVLLRMILGGCLAGLALGAAAYPIAFFTVRLVRPRLQARRHARRARRIAARLAKQNIQPTETISQDSAETAKPVERSA